VCISFLRGLLTSGSVFLDLPPELRIRIYEILLDTDVESDPWIEKVETMPRDHDSSVYLHTILEGWSPLRRGLHITQGIPCHWGLPLTCRQIHQEFLAQAKSSRMELLYNFVFHLRGTRSCLEWVRLPPPTSSIAKLVINLQPALPYQKLYYSGDLNPPKEQDLRRLEASMLERSYREHKCLSVMIFEDIMSLLISLRDRGKKLGWANQFTINELVLNVDFTEFRLGVLLTPERLYKEPPVSKRIKSDSPTQARDGLAEALAQYVIGRSKPTNTGYGYSRIVTIKKLKITVEGESRTEWTDLVLHRFFLLVLDQHTASHVLQEEFVFESKAEKVSG
jgi:hypothetical protein